MTKEEVQIMYNYHLSGFNFKEVCKEFNISSTNSVYYWFKKYGFKSKRFTKTYRNKPVKQKPDKINIKDYSDIVELYNSGKSTIEIANIKNVNRETIAKELFRKRKIPKKRQGYSLNENFFENIDSEIKAYLAGFFYADGCLTNSSIQVLIQERDLEVLEFFRDNISPDKPIHRYDYRHNGVNRQPQVKYKITSKKIYDDLIKLGYTERKTYNDFSMKFVPQNLKSHFIRGFIDGDGGWVFKSIGFSKKDSRYKYIKRLSMVSLCGTLMNEIKEYFNELGIKSSLHSRNTKNMYLLHALCVYKSDYLRIIYEDLYKNANFFLKRKQLRAYYCSLTPRELNDLKIV